MAKNKLDDGSFEYKGRTYHVKGFNCIVEMEMFDETENYIKSDSGFKLYSSNSDHVKERQRSHTVGYLRARGADCWFDKSEPYAKIGDKVLFRRYAGDVCNWNKQGVLPEGHAYLIIMKDDEILGTISE